MVKVFWLTSPSEKRIGFDCPGCGNLHAVPVSERGDGRNWSFNGDMGRPTLAPSILARGTHPPNDEELKRITSGEKIEPRKYVCHSFVRNGNIEFLGDCTHALAGKTIELPEISDA